MCGLVVSIHRNGHIDRGRLSRALDEIGHRGPDAAGADVVQIVGSNGSMIAEAGLGHARLAILDLDPRSNQPFAIGSHRLVYNGEIYNYGALSDGLPLSTTSDTEVLLRLLMRDGPEALGAANGMWAFCWIDVERGRLVAGRDRYGKKPLFYAVEGDAIHFASEPRAVAALLGRPLTIRRSELDGFVADGWVFPNPSGQTPFVAIREVPPGQVLELDMQSWTIEQDHAFPLQFQRRGPGSATSEEALASLLADAVQARLVSDRKVGLFLSGGVDSTLILSILASLRLTEQVVCITGDAGRTEDARYAQACIDQLGIAALNVPLPYDTLGFEQFLAICRAQAKPFPLIGNVLGMHALYAAVAQHDIRVVLDGTGADEIFGGYWHRYLSAALRDAEAARDKAWIEGIRPNMPNSYRHLHAGNGWMPTRELPHIDDLAIMRPEARAAVVTTRPPDPLQDFRGTLPEALMLDATAGRMQEWLWQNDRNAMASSVENRSPFLDVRLANWATTPYHRKFGGDWNKMELRGLFRHFTPLPSAERRDKQGFRWAFDHFFRNNLEGILAMIGGSEMARRYVEPGRFADAIRSGRIGLDSKLLHRLTVIAGLETVGHRPSAE
jgi:asparagine synthase (glutamine-hydrolysing)